MRMLMRVEIPHERFNAAVKDGTAGQKVKRILDETRPEAAYFTNEEGHRSVVLIVNLDEPAKVPSLAEPWFLTFDADVRFHIVMSPEDLGRAGLDGIGRKWA
jgi:hypothetical protein